jgi:hypothetical protein
LKPLKEYYQSKLKMKTNENIIKLDKNTIPKLGFEYLGNFEEGQICVEKFSNYKLKICLLDDGTPLPPTFLVILVKISDDNNEMFIELSIEQKDSNTITLGSFKSSNISAVARLLYPVAFIKTIKRILPK